MILKEAFRYQNYLDDLVNYALSYLRDDTYIMKTELHHMRKKANPEAEDEVVDMTGERTLQCSAGDFILMLTHIMEEKEQLSNAINNAKLTSVINIDAEVANNKLRHRVTNTLSSLGQRRPSERITRGYGYKFNAEGNQTQYTYDIKTIQTIDFDRNAVKAISKSIAKKADEISTQLDKAMVEIEVAYNPPYDVGTSFEDALEEFLNTKPV